MSLPGSSPSVVGRVTALPRPLLAMVTDRRRYVGASAAAGDERACAALVAAAAAAARAGVDLVQVRERGLDDRSLLALAVSVRDAIAATGSPAPRQRPDRRRAGGPRRRRAPARLVPCRAPRSARSCPTASSSAGPSTAPARRSRPQRDGGCDYLVFGSVFESASKPAGPRGRRARRARPRLRVRPGCRSWRLAASPRRGCRTSCGQARPASLR